MQPASMVQVFFPFTMQFVKAPSSLVIAQVENTCAICGTAGAKEYPELITPKTQQNFAEQPRQAHVRCKLVFIR